jgi:hypothetical protein
MSESFTKHQTKQETAESNGAVNNKPMKLKLKLIYVRQSVLVSGAHLGPVTNFSFSLKFPSDSCVFVIL